MLIQKTNLITRKYKNFSERHLGEAILKELLVFTSLYHERYEFEIIKKSTNGGNGGNFSFISGDKNY